MPVKRGLSSETLGLIFALCSAACYTCSNLALRGLTEYNLNNDWTIALRELPGVLVLGAFILVQALRGKYQFPRLKVILSLLFAGALCMFVGARGNLAAFEYVGLSLASPLLQASVLVVSSLVGAFFLRERVTPSKIVATGLLIGAVWLIYSGGSEGTIAGRAANIGLGVLACLIAALGYCGQLSIMRRYLRMSDPSDSNEETTNAKSVEVVPTTFAMIAVSSAAVFGNGGIFAYQHGFGALFDAPAPECWLYVLAAGIGNTLGFAFQIASLRRLYLLKQALIATAQTAILCILGVVLFGEDFGLNALIGVLLILAGVILSAKTK